MITEVTGITRIDTLYLQLLYRCQFRCTHCFHGERLTWRDAYTLGEAIGLVELMRREYDTRAVCLLGGEPFLYTDLAKLLAHIKHDAGMRTEICSNGFRIREKLTNLGGELDLLRISLEGLESANDAIRQPGAFREALSALTHARDLGIQTGVTMTVTATNIQDVVPLARILQELNVGELKLHHLRPVGHAANHPELAITDHGRYDRLRRQLAAAQISMRVLVDEELSGDPLVPRAPYAGSAPRIEADPQGGLTMSCNAVGTDAHALVYDKQKRQILARPDARSEVMLGIAPVVYTHA